MLYYLKWALKIVILSLVLLSVTYTSTTHNPLPRTDKALVTTPDSSALRLQAARDALLVMDSVLAGVDSLKNTLDSNQQNFFVKKDYFEAVLKLPNKEENDSTRRVLVTGDSMGDGIFLALRKLRKKLGYKVDYAPWYGSTTSDWASSDKLKKYLSQYKPDLVIFLLGSNELFVPVSRKRAENVKKVVSMLNDTDYVWVGPPNWKKDWGTDSLLHAHVGSKRYFVSKDLKLERRPDKAHPSFKASEVWLDTLLRWTNKNPHIKFKFVPPAAQETQKVG